MSVGESLILDARDQAQLDATAAEVQRLGPWYSAFDFGDGIKQPLVSPVHNDNAYFKARAERVFGALEQLVKPDECTLIDVGCSDGFFTIEAAKRGFHEVVGIEPRGESVERARFAARKLGVPVEFRQGTIYELESLVGTAYDVVLCLGLFYHLDNPVRAFEQIRRITRRVAFFGGYTANREEATFYVQNEDSADIRNTTGAGLVLVPTPSAVRAVLRAVKFRECIEVDTILRQRQAVGDGARGRRDQQCELLPLSSAFALDPERPTYFYGSGRLGQDLFRTLGDPRMINLTAFVDSFNAGTCQGVPVVDLDGFRAAYRAGDQVVITSSKVREIAKSLAESGVPIAYDANVWHRAYLATEENMKSWHDTVRFYDILAVC